MPNSLRSKLRMRLTARYAELRGRLERLVGSRADASDALQETWLRLETMTQTGLVRDADAYLLRMASNLATDAYRRNNVLVSERERDELMHIADEVADPERIVAARLEVEALEAALLELTPRRRAILTAARVDGLLNAEIAQRFGVSVAMVKKELQSAMRHCKERMADAQAVQLGDVAGRRKY